MRVLFLTKYDRLGASSRYRTFQYIPYLEAEGIHCEASPLFTDGYLAVRYSSGRPSAFHVLGAFYRRLKEMGKFKGFDLVVVEKELFPYLPAFFEKWMLKKARAYSLDYDDALYHIYDQHPNPLVKALLKHKFASLMKKAALVTVGNSYIKDYALNYSRHVKMLPTVIDTSRYPFTPEPEGLFTVGWIGTPNTERYLHLITEPMREFFKLREGRLLLVGASGDFSIEGVPVEVAQWSEDKEAALLREMHVGIMPLPDMPLERGKSGLKLLQYMACGRPVIASPVGVNGEIVNPEVGYLANSDDEWFTSLLKLADDFVLRKRLGHNGRLLVEGLYNLANSARRYALILNMAAVRNDHEST